MLLYPRDFFSRYYPRLGRICKLNSPNFSLKKKHLKTVNNLFQAAYVRKLEQQADSIRQLLKLLNNTGGSAVTTSTSSKEGRSQGSGGREQEEEGYEQLWELGTNCNGGCFAPQVNFPIRIRILG